jgi:nucleotide-binding universal stress UspA family protein
MFRKILVAVGGPEDASQTVPVVAYLAKALGAEVQVIHLRLRVVKVLAVEEKESVHESFEFGQDVVKRLVDAGVDAAVDIDSSRPENIGQFILGKADKFEADLIVVGGHHAHGLRDRVFGDMGKVLAHGAKCPLLMMPSDPE